MNFKEVKEDYLRIMVECDAPYDMTGGFVDAEKMEKVILNPTKRNAAEYMVSVIQYGFRWGDFWKSESGEVGLDNPTVLKMFNKYVADV